MNTIHLKKIFLFIIIIISIYNISFARSYSWSKFEYGSWRYSYHVPNFVLRTESYNGNELILSNSFKNDLNNLSNTFKITLGIKSSSLTKNDIGKKVSCNVRIGNISLNGYAEIELPGTFKIFVNNLVNTIYNSNSKNIDIILPNIHINANFSLIGFNDAFYSALHDHKNGFHTRSLTQSSNEIGYIIVGIGIIALLYFISHIFSNKSNGSNNNSIANNSYKKDNQDSQSYKSYNVTSTSTNQNNYIKSTTYNNYDKKYLGYVYILSNIAMPGIYKIGYTSRDPEERIYELNKSTSIPTPFNIEYVIKSNNYVQIEADIHRELSNYRFGKEFFKLDLQKCIDTLNKICNKYNTV